MTHETITDLRRELEKARHALAAAQAHLAAHAEMNAALHCASDRVMYSPLHAKVTATIAGIDHALARSADQPAPEHSDTTCPWAGLISDFDRCEHGRHEGDACGGSCGTVSEGNPHMQTGQVIGYTMRRIPIVMPSRNDKYTLAAWYRRGDDA